MRLFVITGKAKAGKNTFGNYLKEELKKYGYKPCVMHLTEPLYTYARNYFDWDEHSSEKPREFLQKMGIEIIKNKLHKDNFLINRLCEDIEILEEFFDTFIITDARLKMEFDTLKERYDDVVTIKITRDDYDDGLDEEERKHITETDLDDYKGYDYEIKNDTINDLINNSSMIIKTEERKKHE